MEFVMAPNLHWPDTMFSYDHATGVMYTCDAFGMHYCTEEPFDTDVQAIMPHYRWEAESICTSRFHVPVQRHNVNAMSPVGERNNAADLGLLSVLVELTKIFMLSLLLYMCLLVSILHHYASLCSDVPWQQRCSCHWLTGCRAAVTLRLQVLLRLPDEAQRKVCDHCTAQGECYL
jgi:hypothetical protein